MMHRLTLFSLIVFLAACSSVNSRIESHQAEFDSYPVEVQSAIRNGEVQLGFTELQVRMAWGDPSNTAREVSEATGEQIVWGYRDSSPTVSFGVGVGGGSGHRSTAAGVGVSSGGHQEYEKIAVFSEGRVVDIRYFDN
jgi:hypothetical protein